MQYHPGILLLFVFQLLTLSCVSGQSVTGLESSSIEQANPALSSSFEISGASDIALQSVIIIGTIQITGNKKTSETVIRRELLFKTGDSIRKEELITLLQISKENILKTSLFHTADISSFYNDNTLNFIVNVTERWYWWIWPLIENPDRNINDWWQHNDLTRLSAGLHFQHENIRGRMEKLNLKAMGGYKTYLEGSYEWPYINKSKSLGIGVFASYTSRYELNFATIENKQVFYHGKDIMFESVVLAANAKYRRGIHFTHFLTLQYWQPWFSDSISFLNPEYLLKENDPKLLGFSYLLKADFRDNRYYPLKGFYTETEAGYLIDLAQQYTQQSFRTSLRGYIPVAKSLYAASEFAFQFTNPAIKPYYLQNALGYDRDFIRGYEYLVIEAPHYWIFKSHLKYAAVPLTIFKVPFINSEKFNTIPLSIYAGFHFDMGKAFPALDPTTNTLQGKLLAGYGIGIDFVTYYDKVLRCEYTFRKDGPSGFFLHFMAMI